ncbi:MAG TPA: tetratricopeptide repeat protein [Candidatus Eremiobacteraeota bacterium]|nr:MAG: Serine/threonine-protein kinase PrkC [bacterium ADurb.Bin363]HPZ09434.1 tetratricopeptide repeat protein [Candidatus Eremiobacteraeota bacterium]
MEVLKSGEIIESRFRIDELLKTDSRGATYKGYDVVLNKICFVKEIFNYHVTLRQKRDAKRKFDLEARHLSELRHKKLTRIMGYSGTDERCYLVMEYIYGYDLNTAFFKEAALSFPQEKVILWMMEVCEVLEYLHGQYEPFIFRDIKPSNIMINELDGTIRLVDFGIAHTLEVDTEIKPELRGYNAPEIEDEKPDVRSDVYSLGATMYNLLTGVVPMPPQIRRLSDLNSDVSPKVHDIVMKALKLNPEDRFQTVRELHNELLKYGASINGSIHTESIDILMANLNQGDISIRKSAIKSLGELDDDEAIGPLINTLKEDPDPLIRKEIVMALKNYKEDIVIKAMCDAFKVEDNPEVRADIINILGDFKAREAIDLLIAALKDPFAAIQLESINALGNIKDKKALDPLFDLFKDEKFVFREEVRVSMDKIDSKFVKLWEETEEKAKAGRSQNRSLIMVASIVVALILSLVLLKVIPDFLNAKKVKENLLQGETLLENKDYKTALPLFDEVINRDSTNARGYYGRGICNINLNKIKTAVEDLEKAVKLDGGNPDYKISLGMALLLNKNITDAITQLEKAMEVKKDSPEAYLYLGRAYYANKEEDKALEMFNYCVSNYPKTDFALESNNWIAIIRDAKHSSSPGGFLKELNKAKTCLYSKDYDRAIQMFDDILRKNPTEVEAIFGKGMAYLNKEEYNQAKTFFNQVLSLNFNHVSSCIALAGISSKEGEYSKAIDYCTRAISNEAGRSEAYYIRGIAYHNIGKKQEALSDFKKFIEFALPGDPYVNEVKSWIEKIEGGS